VKNYPVSYFRIPDGRRWARIRNKKGDDWFMELGLAVMCWGAKKIKKLKREVYQEAM